jgi:hypothetical protein
LGKGSHCPLRVPHTEGSVPRPPGCPISSGRRTLAPASPQEADVCGPAMHVHLYKRPTAVLIQVCPFWAVLISDRAMGESDSRIPTAPPRDQLITLTHREGRTGETGGAGPTGHNCGLSCSLFFADSDVLFSFFLPFILS